MLPDQQPPGALALYSEQTHTCTGVAHDLALLLAAQSGVALTNLDRYADAQATIEHLHCALQTRGWIEQAKTIIATDRRVPLDDAFTLLARESQNARRKLADVARNLVRRRCGAGAG